MRRLLLLSSLLASVVVACAAPAADDTAVSSSAQVTTHKHVTVSLADQRARAYEGDRCVREWPVSTGSWGNETWLPFAGRGVTPKQQVDFPILAKSELVMMTDPTGQGRYTNAPVKWDVRLTNGGIFFHEADWTNIPGTSSDCGHCGFTGNAPAGTSHGCVNEKHDDAVWFYGWAPAPDPRVNVVHLSFDSFAPEACDVVSAPSGGSPAPAAKRNAGTDEAKQDTGAGYDECLTGAAYASFCLEDLSATDYLCWRNGQRSSSGQKTCVDGTWK
jgi:hypothetical protein